MFSYSKSLLFKIIPLIRNDQSLTEVTSKLLRLIQNPLYLTSGVTFRNINKTTLLRKSKLLTYNFLRPVSLEKAAALTLEIRLLLRSLIEKR